MKYWIDENLHWLVIAGLLAVVVALIVLIGVDDAEKRAEFMADCQRHRPKYECTAMWRSGESRSPVVVPVAVPVTR